VQQEGKKRKTTTTSNNKGPLLVTQPNDYYMQAATKAKQSYTQQHAT